ncbi:MAG: hypothetical protein RJQ09_12580 [Cyclobacteriaceae bacterium]
MPTLKKHAVDGFPAIKSLEPNKPLWWIKLTNWEFWPFSVFYFPIYFYYLWLAVKSRSLFFFSSSNPGIEYGGMLGESKIKIFDKIIARYKPYTQFFKQDTGLEKLIECMGTNGLTFPVILKPDVGERGWMVKKIDDQAQMTEYLEAIKVPFLLQEFIEWPIEIGVFYVRLPFEESGKVTSINLKKMLSVKGDGESTVEELLLSQPRAVIAFNEIKKTSGHLFDFIPSLEEEVEVVPIGNHCRGTTFINGNHLINERIHQVFDKAAKSYPGFYFGRFDIRSESIEALEMGEFKIMELNGCGAEPGHIYHPGYPLFAAYKSLIYHLDCMYQIAKWNNNNGSSYMTFNEGMALIKFVRNYNHTKD